MLWPQKERRVRLRDVELGDVDAYVRMRCDPVMMAELGGPLPREDIEDKVARDVRAAAASTNWIKMIVPDEAAPDVVAGNVVLWSHDENGEPVSEIGWMVLPEFQGPRARQAGCPDAARDGPRRRPLGARARVPGDVERPLKRHLPLPRLQVRR